MKRLAILAPFWLFLLGGLSLAGYAATAGHYLAGWLLAILCIAIAAILASMERDLMRDDSSE